jgi:hypothetical protein
MAIMAMQMCFNLEFINITCHVNLLWNATNSDDNRTIRANAIFELRHAQIYLHFHQYFVSSLHMNSPTELTFVYVEVKRTESWHY